MYFDSVVVSTMTVQAYRFNPPVDKHAKGLWNRRPWLEGEAMANLMGCNGDKLPPRGIAGDADRRSSQNASTFGVPMIKAFGNESMSGMGGSCVGASFVCVASTALASTAYS